MSHTLDTKDLMALTKMELVQLLQSAHRSRLAEMTARIKAEGELNLIKHAQRKLEHV